MGYVPDITHPILTRIPGRRPPVSEKGSQRPPGIRSPHIQAKVGLIFAHPYRPAKFAGFFRIKIAFFPKYVFYGIIFLAVDTLARKTGPWRDPQKGSPSEK